MRRQLRRPGDGSVLHRVGQAMVHKAYGYRGLIYGWTPTCQAHSYFGIASAKCEVVKAEAGHVAACSKSPAVQPGASQQCCMHLAHAVRQEMGWSSLGCVVGRLAPPITSDCVLALCTSGGRCLDHPDERDALPGTWPLWLCHGMDSAPLGLLSPLSRW